MTESPESPQTQWHNGQETVAMLRPSLKDKESQSRLRDLDGVYPEGNGRTREDQLTEPLPGQASPSRVPTGPASAALLAAGIGCLAFGLSVILAVASSDVKQALNFYHPVGPLSGKSTVPIVLWVLTWGVLHWAWKDRDVHFRRSFAVTLFLVALSLVATFPPFFDLFHR